MKEKIKLRVSKSADKYGSSGYKMCNVSREIMLPSFRDFGQAAPHPSLPKRITKKYSILNRINHSFKSSLRNPIVQ